MSVPASINAKIFYFACDVIGYELQLSFFFRDRLMKFSMFISTFAGAFLLAGCVETTNLEEAGPVTTQLAGKTAVSKAGWTFNFSPDGRLSGSEADGSEISGTWTERDGQFFRTLTLPERLAGTLCQDVEFTENQVSFLRKDGSATVMTFH